MQLWILKAHTRFSSNFYCIYSLPFQTFPSPFTDLHRSDIFISPAMHNLHVEKISLPEREPLGFR